MFKNVTYDRVKASIDAICGTPRRDTEVQALLNDSVSFAYESSKYWPRYLRVEPRTLSRGYVEFEEDSFYAYGAGTSGVNNLMVANGTSDGVTKYSVKNDALVLVDLERSTTWSILAGADSSEFAEDTVLYTNTSTADTPPLTGWVSSNGEDPVPELVDLSDIGEPIQVWTAQPGSTAPSAPCKFYTDGLGIRVPKVDGDVVWVAFKADLDSEFGNGTGGTITSIPKEFAEYAKYDVAYQLQFSERQSQENPYASFAYRKVTDRLDQYLLKITDETGHRLIRDRFQTYFGTDVSVRV